MSRTATLLDGFNRTKDYLEKHGKADENGEKWIDLETAAAIIGRRTGV
jgi:hypothetical protein